MFGCCLWNFRLDAGRIELIESVVQAEATAFASFFGLLGWRALFKF
jgi:hypothetical protein